MIKYNIKICHELDPKRDLSKTPPFWNGEREFGITLPDDWGTVEVRDALKQHGIIVDFPDRFDDDPEGHYTVYSFPVQYELDEWTELPVVWMIIDPDYRRIPDKFNEALITV